MVIAFDNDPTYDLAAGIAYDEVDDTLYIFGRDNQTVNVGLVLQMRPVTQGGTWADFSDTLVPIGAETHYHVESNSSNHMSMIPR